MQRLQKIQNWAARSIDGAMRYSHATPLLKKLHWLPIVLRVELGRCDPANTVYCVCHAQGVTGVTELSSWQPQVYGMHYRIIWHCHVWLEQSLYICTYLYYLLYKRHERRLWRNKFRFSDERGLGMHRVHVHSRMNGWMNEWVDEWTNGRMDEWTDGRMDGWTDGRMDGWTDGRMDGWMVGWMDGWMDGWIDGCFCWLIQWMN